MELSTLLAIVGVPVAAMVVALALQGLEQHLLGCSRSAEGPRPGDPIEVLRADARPARSESAAFRARLPQ